VTADEARLAERRRAGIGGAALLTGWGFTDADGVGLQAWFRSSRAKRVPAVVLRAVVPLAAPESELGRGPQDDDDDRGDP
jgi:hypothetical protein